MFEKKLGRTQEEKTKSFMSLRDLEKCCQISDEMRTKDDRDKSKFNKLLKESYQQWKKVKYGEKGYYQDINDLAKPKDRLKVGKTLLQL